MIVNLPLIIGTTYINNFVYEIRFSDSSKKRLNFKDVDIVGGDNIIKESGVHSDFGKSFIFKTLSGDQIELSSVFLYDI
tara:strand:- start:265 stop:501 length:237 start_codon:yes stop_codon:yes gene_type:complete